MFRRRLKRVRVREQLMKRPQASALSTSAQASVALGAWVQESAAPGTVFVPGPSSRRGLGLLLVTWSVLFSGSVIAFAQDCWDQVATTGPLTRQNHAMAYDAQRGVTVLFGGAYGIYDGETWEWGGREWTKVATTGPSPRGFHAMAYDVQIGATVLFGGYDNSPDGETWEWDGSTWSPAATSGPSPRYAHAMAYDAQRGVTVLFGGYDGSRYGDTWEWDGSTWTPVATTGPSPRFAHAMAYDAKRGVTVLFGGYDGSFDDETWEWNGSIWTQVATGPSPRGFHAMAYNAQRGVSILFGGSDDSQRNGETWEWDGSTWTPAATEGPSPRYGHAMADDAQRGMTVLFGGNDGPLDGETWEYGQGDICEACITAFGLKHCPLGQASLELQDGKLVVSNIGSSGEDGVSVELPQSTAYWQPELNDLGDPADPDNPVPDGAFMRLTTLGTLDGQPDQIISVAHHEDMGAVVKSTIDFSRVEPELQTGRALCEGRLVHKEAHEGSDATEWQLPRWLKRLDLDRHFGVITGSIRIPIGISGECLLVQTPNGVEVQAEYINIAASELPVTFNGYSEARLTFKDTGPMTIESELLETDCGEENVSVKATCKGGGEKVIGKLKHSFPGTEVTFRVDTGQEKVAITSDRGTAKAKWTRLDPIGHLVTVCQLADECP